MDIEIDKKEYFLEWSLNIEEEYLQTSDFKIICSTDSEFKAKIPLLWFKDLFNKDSKLSILRTPNHIPKDPYELVEFIKSLKDF